MLDVPVSPGSLACLETVTSAMRANSRCSSGCILRNVAISGAGTATPKVCPVPVCGSVAAGVHISCPILTRLFEAMSAAARCTARAIRPLHLCSQLCTGCMTAAPRKSKLAVLARCHAEPSPLSGCTSGTRYLGANVKVILIDRPVYGVYIVANEIYAGCENDFNAQG
jgi:hypothetical protein